MAETLSPAQIDSACDRANELLGSPAAGDLTQVTDGYAKLAEQLGLARDDLGMVVRSIAAGAIESTEQGLSSHQALLGAALNGLALGVVLAEEADSG